MKKVIKPGAGYTLLLLLVGTYNAMAAPVAYIDETTFLADLAAMGYTPVHEGFEDDSVWATTRGQVVAEIPSQGLIWTANNPHSGITTGAGPALTGQYGFYSSPHGSYSNPPPGVTCFTPGECGDGWRGRAADGLIYAIGGWLDTNTPFAKIGLFIGEYPDNPIDFGETCVPPESENCFGNSTVGTTPRFFGVIDTDGFERFEYREMEGKLEIDGGDIKFIFSDDFYFVLSDLGGVFKDGFEQ